MKFCSNLHWKKTHQEDDVSAGVQAANRPTSYLWSCVTSEQMRQSITWKQKVETYTIHIHLLAP